MLGGSDVDNNFSKRNLFFNRYQKFTDKPPMATKRAFFPSCFSITDSSLYALGGQDGIVDLNLCEKFSI